MERTPAACAMEWSIELEKGLRSKKPGKSVEAILQIGLRLECWNIEPPPKMAEFKMFGLIPGEDKLFANAIILRLADAFRLGDKSTKVAVVKIFLSELRHRKRRHQRNNGRLTKHKFDNHLELVGRIKVAFDSVDVEDRALALLLFGCWAEFANDNAEIRYLIFSSLVSRDVLEVKASLFAAGCFCEFSDDFGYVVLEMLVSVVTSPETLKDIRLAGARAFSKMGCSFSLANRAYETALKLVLDSSDEDLSVVMLISLSKIASKSTLLISMQIELLLSFCAPEKTLHLQATSLRCLHFVLARGVYFSPTADLIKTLLVIIKEPKYPSALQCEVLKILHKIFLHNVASISCMDEIEFLKLITTVENVIQSPIMLKRLLAIHVLVDISGKLVSTANMALDGVGFAIASRVISHMVDHVALLVKQIVDLRKPDLQVEQEVKSLLKLLLALVKECPRLGGMVLDRVCLFIEDLVDVLDGVFGKGKAELAEQEIIEFGQGKETFVTSKLVLYVSNIVITCLKNVKEAGVVTTQVLDTLKLLVEYVCKCTLFSFYTRTIHFCLLHSWMIHLCIWSEMEENSNPDSSCDVSVHDSFIQYAVSTLECAKRTLARKNNWSAYKAGKFAACQGTWFIAAFIFDQLICRVQSDSCHSWLRFLAQFAYSEMKVQLLFLSEQDSSIVNWFETNKFSTAPSGDILGKTSGRTAWEANLPRYIENFVGCCNILDSSKETMRSSITGHVCGFQRWFLSLRARMLQNVVDILKLFPLSSQQMGDNMVGSPILQRAISLENPLTKISLQLKRLAQELDLIATSFIGIDCKSLTIISALALSSSLLAFATGFTLFAPNQHELEKVKVCSLDRSEDRLHALLVQDLMMRLWHIDFETSNKLWMLLKVCGQPKSCVLPQLKNHLSNIGYDAKSVPAVCSYAVTRIVSLQNEAKKVHDDKSTCKVTNDRLQLLLDIVVKWMRIPFQTPIEFFQFRPCASSELFAMNGDTGTLDEIFVLPGFQLSLNLCLQLRNVPPYLPAKVTKSYCILYCEASDRITHLDRENRGKTVLGCEEWGSNDMVDLNEKLLRHVRGSIKTRNVPSGNTADDCRVLDAFVCFELNKRGQGFLTCLHDVSAFPVGSYRIKWHSGCVDSNGAYWSLLPLNAGPIFTVQR